MTIGIYALYWAEQDLIYIGQSIDIENRFITHKRSMCNGTHFNYKVQETYNNHGLPETVTLIECNAEELSYLEVSFMREFNNLLNIAEGGNSPSGVDGRNSQYPKTVILKVFSLLYKSKFNCVEIAKRTKTTTDVVYCINEGRTHVWLKEVYPDKYSRMLSIDRTSLKIKALSLTKEILDELIPQYSWVSLGKMFGYTDTGIRKRAKSLGCKVPTRRKVSSNS